MLGAVIACRRRCCVYLMIDITPADRLCSVLAAGIDHALLGIE